MEESCQLLGREGLHLPVLQFGRGTAVCGVGADQLLVDGEIHGGGNDLVDVADGFGTQPLGLALGLDPHLDLGAVLKPHIHPLAHSVLLCPDGVHLGVFLDGPLQLLLAALLGLGKDSGVLPDTTASENPLNRGQKHRVEAG